MPAALAAIVRRPVAVIWCCLRRRQPGAVHRVVQNTKWNRVFICCRDAIFACRVGDWKWSKVRNRNVYFVGLSRFTGLCFGASGYLPQNWSEKVTISAVLALT